MANEHKIEVYKRDKTKKINIKKLRREGNIPGIYYSPTTNNSTPIFISEREYNLAIKSGARIFNISVGEKKQTVLFKSIQHHPVTDKVLHIDLYGIKMDQAINIKIPISLIGDPVGVIEEGGVLNQPINEIEIQCLPLDIPENIQTDISDLKLGNSINVGNLEIDKKFTLVTPEDTVLVSVTHAMKEVEPTTEVSDDEAFLDDESSDAIESKEDDKSQDKSSDNQNENNDGENS